MIAASVVKYLIIVFALLCLVGGIYLVIVGIQRLVKVNDTASEFRLTLIILVPIGIILIGIIIIVVSSFGCFAAFMESPCMLIAFAVMLLVIISFQLAFIILFLCFLQPHHSVKKGINQSLSVTLINARNNDEDAKESFFSLQNQTKCCGVNGTADWERVNLPESCCKMRNDFCYSDQAYPEGCANKAFEEVDGTLTSLAYSFIVLEIVEIIAAILTIWLANRIIYCEGLG